MTGMPDVRPGPLVPGEVARRLVAARLRGAVLDVPLTDAGPFSLDDAYTVQREVTALRLARGERVVGWKLGYTSLAMRAQMGIDQPNLGPLTDTMLLTQPGSSGHGVVPPSALQPRVEPEIALRLARPVPAGSGVDEVLAACDGAFAALEVVDSVWAGYRFRIEDNTADGSSAAWVVLGPALPLDDLPAIAVRLLVDGEEVATSTGAAASGHPAAGVGWLAGQVGPRTGLALAAGDVVITGGLTAAHVLAPGSVVAAEFSAPRGGPDVRVEVTRAG